MVLGPFLQGSARLEMDFLVDYRSRCSAVTAKTAAGRFLTLGTHFELLLQVLTTQSY